VNSEIKKVNYVSIFKKEWGWFWLEEAAWECDSLSELGSKVYLRKLSLDGSKKDAFLSSLTVGKIKVFIN